MTDKPLNPRWLRYRGGPDSGWQQLAEPLPKGFLRADASKQNYGMGGPIEIYGPLDRVCRDCGKQFVFSAREQKHWYETLRFFVDATAVRCKGCRQVAHAKRAYSDAVSAATAAPSAKTHIAVARAVLSWNRLSKGAPLHKGALHARAAGKLGAAAQAEDLLHAIKLARKSPHAKPAA